MRIAVEEPLVVDTPSFLESGEGTASTKMGTLLPNEDAGRSAILGRPGQAGMPDLLIVVNLHIQQIRGPCELDALTPGNFTAIMRIAVPSIALLARGKQVAFSIMNIRFTWIRWALMGVVCGGGVSGCMTLEDPRARQAVQEREDVLLIREDNRRLAGRIEGLELEVERLQRELAAQRMDQDRRAAQGQSADTKYAELERRMSELDRARERDKQEVVDRLTKTIEQLMKSQPSAGSSKKAGSGYGYEHVVGPGETLSQIASVYGVRPQAIIEANRLDKPDLLRVGQKLFIPE